MAEQWRNKPGLKHDLILAKVKAAEDSGMKTPLATKDGGYIEREAHHTAEAIVNFITKANFTITQLKAPVILEDFKIPEQPVDVKIETLLGDKAPLFKTLKTIGAPVPGIGAIIDSLEGAIKQAVRPLTKDGATAQALNLGKDLNGLQATGYVYIGDDPQAQTGFNVEDEDGQRQFTSVQLFKDDAQGII